MVWDAVIIGGGQAGPPLAHGLAAKGWRVALIEADKLGGSCVNFGCTPTKAAVASAKLAHKARRAAEFGLKIPTVEVDFPEVLAQAHAVAEQSRTGLEEWFAEAPEGNPALVRGRGRLDGKEGELFRVLVGDEVHLAKVVVLNTGTASRLPPIEGLSSCAPITAENWLYRTDLPKRLAVVGGGIVSIELAQFYQRMGSQVTVIEHGRQILSTEDEDVAARIQTMLEAEGIEFRTGVSLARVMSTEDGLALSCAGESGDCEVMANAVFYSIGRMPNTSDIGLETVAIEPDHHGILSVDAHLQTSTAGIYAAGDIRGGFQLTSTAWDDFRIIENVLVGDGTKTTDRVVPYAIFTDPALGRVGANERQLWMAGTPYKVLRFELAHSGIAKEERETAGFLKILIDPATELVLGAAVVAPAGGELVHLYAQLMVAGLPVSVIRDAVMGHPTYAEAVQSAVS